MATLREYFDTDLNKCLSVHKPWGVRDLNGNELDPLIARISQDFDANAKYWSFYIPPGGVVGNYISAIFQAPEVKSCVLGPVLVQREMEFSVFNISYYSSSTKRVRSRMMRPEPLPTALRSARLVVCIEPPQQIPRPSESEVALSADVGCFSVYA
jgi:hypothetical protein